MADKKSFLLRAQQIADSMQTFSHPWNPKSEISGTQMGRLLGLKRTGVNFVKVPAIIKMSNLTSARKYGI
jgi:uncharacterized cupin superfamily protein